MNAAAFDWTGFEVRYIDVNGVRIRARVDAGAPNGRPVLVLVHGYPQSHVMWRRVAQALRPDFFIVMPDLRGYGESTCPPDQPDHAQASKRAMAADVTAVMDALGVQHFFLCGHDRGARVAHRLVLDHPGRVARLCLIDIAPTLDMYEQTDMAFARAYYHWFFLIQPAPLPEMMIGPVARDYLLANLGGWGSGGLNHIETDARAEYERCFCRPETIHAVCEDYRASAGIDLTHDRESREHEARIDCDTLVLWGERGVIHRLFDPLALWQAQCAGRVVGEPMPAGHFIPEELPDANAAALKGFMHG